MDHHHWWKYALPRRRRPGRGLAPPRPPDPSRSRRLRSPGRLQFGMRGIGAPPRKNSTGAQLAKAAKVAAHSRRHRPWGAITLVISSTKLLPSWACPKIAMRSWSDMRPAAREGMNGSSSKRPSGQPPLCVAAMMRRVCLIQPSARSSQCASSQRQIGGPLQRALRWQGVRIFASWRPSIRTAEAPPHSGPLTHVEGPDAHSRGDFGRQFPFAAPPERTFRSPTIRARSVRRTLQPSIQQIDFVQGLRG